MFTVVSIWRTNASDTGDVMRRRAQDELMPVFRALPGFIDYRSMTVNDDRFVVVHTWHSRTQGLEGMRQSGDWALQFMPSVMRLERLLTGDVIAASFAP
jgi:hypothetical protein